MAAPSSLPHHESSVLDTNISAIVLGYEVEGQDKKLRISFPSGSRRFSASITEFQLGAVTKNVCTSLVELESILRSAVVHSNGVKSSLVWHGDSKVELAIEIATPFFSRSFSIDLWTEHHEDLHDVIKRLETRVDSLETKLSTHASGPSSSSSSSVTTLPRETIALLFIEMQREDLLDQYRDFYHVSYRSEKNILTFSLFPSPPSTFEQTLHRACYLRTQGYFHEIHTRRDRFHVPSSPVFFPPPSPISAYSLVIIASQTVKSWLGEVSSASPSTPTQQPFYPDEVVDGWKNAALSGARIGWFSYVLPASSGYRVVLDTTEGIPPLSRLNRMLPTLRTLIENDLVHYRFYSSNFPNNDEIPSCLGWNQVLSIEAQSRKWPIILVHPETRQIVVANPFPAHLFAEKDQKETARPVIPSVMNLLWSAMFDAAADLLDW